MRSLTSTVLSTLHAVQDFMTTHASELGNLNTSASRQDLDNIEATLSSQARAQASSKNGGNAAGSRARVAKNTLLVKYMRPISAIAQSKLSQSSDFAGFKLPKSTRSAPQLVAAAQAMRDAAAKHADTFIAAGMTPTFLTELDSATNELLSAETSKSASRTSRAGATSALAVNAKQAHKVVKALDALIEPLLANDPALLVKWKATKRFSGAAQGISTATTDSAQSSPASAAPPTTSPTSGAPATAGGATAA